MKMQYDKEADILAIEFTNGKIIRDISLGWNANVGMTASGVGEIVVLDTKAAASVGRMSVALTNDLVVVF